MKNRLVTLANRTSQKYRYTVDSRRTTKSRISDTGFVVLPNLPRFGIADLLARNLKPTYPREAIGLSARASVGTQGNGFAVHRRAGSDVKTHGAVVTNMALSLTILSPLIIFIVGPLGAWLFSQASGS